MAKDGADNDALPEETPSFGPDANGQAAMLLVESLIHGLISKSVISVAEAVEIVEIAADITTEIAAEADNSRMSPKNSLTLLTAIADSLKPDIV